VNYRAGVSIWVMKKGGPQDWHERRLGRIVLRTHRTTADLDDVFPNPNQLRVNAKEDPEFQRQIEANEGVSEPLLLEPHPEHPAKFRIIDGHRRWINSAVLVNIQRKGQHRRFPAEITERTLSDDERLRVWIYLQKQRKEWDQEREAVAYRLVELVGRATAANILDITVREVDKLIDIYSLSEKLHILHEPAASITWAREIKNLSRKIVNQTVLDTIILKINGQEVTNSKDVRKLRAVLRNPVAREEFLSKGGTIQGAIEKLEPAEANDQRGLAGDIAALIESIKRHPWTTLAELKGDQTLIRRIEEAEKLLKQLKKALSR
jgi:ParB family transcriptional regulator, chromosome partitioning protein